MARRTTVSEIRHHLTGLGLGTNPVEKITHHKDGSVTIWVVGLAEPVEMVPPSSARTSAKGQPPAPRHKRAL